MGINILRSSSSYDEPPRRRYVSASREDFSLPNPNPDNYRIEKHTHIRGLLVIEIKYLDCINHEGRKVMVYKCTYEELMKQKTIDPHFSDSKDFISPIARFEPTPEGWLNAIKFCSCI
jgi:hypothetical protein